MTSFGAVALWAELTANKDELSTNRCIVVWRVWRRVNSGRWSSAADDRSRESILFVNVHRLHGRSDGVQLREHSPAQLLRLLRSLVLLGNFNAGLSASNGTPFGRFWVRSEPFSFFSCGNMDSSGTVDKTMSGPRRLPKQVSGLLLDWGTAEATDLPSQKIRLNTAAIEGIDAPGCVVTLYVLSGQLYSHFTLTFAQMQADMRDIAF